MQGVDADRRGAAFGAILAAFDTGIGTGSTSMGWLIQHFGFAAAFGVAAALSALALPYFLAADRLVGVAGSFAEEFGGTETISPRRHGAEFVGDARRGRASLGAGSVGVAEGPGGSKPASVLDPLAPPARDLTESRRATGVVCAQLVLSSRASVVRSSPSYLRPPPEPPAQNPKPRPSSSFRAGPADVGSPKNGDVITPL